MTKPSAKIVHSSNSVAQSGRKSRKIKHRTQSTVSRKKSDISSREKRKLLQFLLCGCAFVLLVALKLLLPERMAQLNAHLSNALQQNIDVQAVFSAVGHAVAGEAEDGELYQAVFGPNPVQNPSEKLPAPKPTEALALLKTELPKSEPAEPSKRQSETESPEAAPISVRYSAQNLPENVSLEQNVLGFAYCTPVCGTLTSAFGYRDHPVFGEERFHYGLDLAANTGTDIICFADGTVTAVGESSSYGNYCTVQHANGYETLYAHCSRITVPSGASVKKGAKIAEVGESGIATGSHLHFELHKNGVYLNPIYYVQNVQT